VKKFIQSVVLLSLFVFSTSLFAQTKRSDKEDAPQAVASVDLKRYAGKWFEIARYPNKFQKKCVANTTATYSLNVDGSLGVLNQCLVKNGTLEGANGMAKIIDSASNAKFAMSFAAQYKSFSSDDWRDYWILDLDVDYQYAAVGDPRRQYLMILSRTPEMSDATYQNILRRVEKLGFNPAKLQKTTQNAQVGKGAIISNQ
jgi:apolipoprotein D and lipocalin family protein